MCESCERAKVNPNTGRFSAGCLGCEARALARSPAALDAMQGHPQALQAAMRKVWPTQDGYRRGRIAVFQIIKEGDK